MSDIGGQSVVDGVSVAVMGASRGSSPAPWERRVRRPRHREAPWDFSPRKASATFAKKFLTAISGEFGAVIDAETVRMIESDVSLVVGLVDGSGAPIVSRACGLNVLDANAGTVRLLLDAEDAPALAELVHGAVIALTTGNVRTHEAKQFKGHVVSIEAATPADNARAAQYYDDFCRVVEESDGIERAAVERLIPTRFVACLIAFDEMFDQTPGPGAGAPIEGET
jgi:hypothetical protein